MSTTDAVLKALVRLEGNQDFERVMEHLQAQYADAIETGAVASELILIGRAQGAQQVLSGFLKLAREARAILAKRG